MHGRGGAYMHVALSDQDPFYMKSFPAAPRAALPGFTRRETAGAGVRIISTLWGEGEGGPGEERGAWQLPRGDGNEIASGRQSDSGAMYKHSREAPNSLHLQP